MQRTHFKNNICLCRGVRARNDGVHRPAFPVRFCLSPYNYVLGYFQATSAQPARLTKLWSLMCFQGSWKKVYAHSPHIDTAAVGNDLNCKFLPRFSSIKPHSRKWSRSLCEKRKLDTFVNKNCGLFAIFSPLISKLEYGTVQVKITHESQRPNICFASRVDSLGSIFLEFATKNLFLRVLPFNYCRHKCWSDLNS